MSITTTEEFDSHARKIQKRNLQIVKETREENDFQQLTISAIVKTMLGIIRVKKNDIMDDETRKQFPAIEKEIILFAKQAQ